MIDGHFVVNSCDLVVLLVTVLSTVKTRVISNEEDLCLDIVVRILWNIWPSEHQSGKHDSKSIFQNVLPTLPNLL